MTNPEPNDEPALLPRRRILAGLSAVLLTLLGGQASAQPLRRRLQNRRRRRFERFRRRGGGRRFRERGPSHRDRARAAIMNGEARPLRELNARLRARGVELLDADLFETPAGWVYDLRVLGPAGRIRDVLVDARTLRRLSGPGGGPKWVDPLGVD